MDKYDTVYSGEFFIKVRPTDNRKEVEASKKELLKLKRKILAERERVNSLEVIREADLVKLRELVEECKCVEINASTPGIITTGMKHFWELSLKPDKYVLTTLPNQPNDEFIMNEYKNLDKLFAEYKSVPDIINSSEFVGKRMYFSNQDISLYMLYRYEEGFMAYVLDENGNVFGLSLAFGDTYHINPGGESMPELDDPCLVYKTINNLKRNMGN